MNHDDRLMLMMAAFMPAALLLIAGGGWRKLALGVLLALGGALGGAVVLGLLGGVLGSATDTGSGEWRGLGAFAFGVLGLGLGSLAGFVGTFAWLLRRRKIDWKRKTPQPVMLGVAVLGIGFTIFGLSREETAQAQLPSPVQRVAIDPAGMLVASGGENGVVRLWNAADLSRRGDLPSKLESMVTALAFSPEGSVLAVARLGGHALELWNVADGTARLAASLSDAPFGDSALAFSPDGKLLAAGGTDNPTRLYELREGVARLRDPHLTTRSEGLVFSADSHTLITDDGRNLVWWDLTQTPPEPRRTITAAEHQFRSAPALAISADGATLAVSGEVTNKVRIWDLRGDQPVERMRFPDHCTQLAFSANGRLLASASYEQAMYPSKEKSGPRVRLWDVGGTNAVQLVSMSAHFPAQMDGAAVSSVALSADGKTLISGGRDGTVQARDFADGQLNKRAEARNQPLPAAHE